MKLRALWLSLLILACEAPKAEESSKESSSKALLRVETLELKPKHLREYIQLQGETLAFRELLLSSELPGRIEELSVHLGDQVKEGQVIARIDFRTQRAQLRQIRAQLELAQSSHRRLKELLKEEMATQQQVDQASSQVTQSRAGLELARIQWSKSVIKAPLSGLVTLKRVERGEYVMPGAPLLKIMDHSKIMVMAQVPEQQIAELKKGMKVHIKIGSLERSFEGEINVLIPSGHPESHTYEIRVELDNPEREILVGMAAELKILSQSHEEAVVIAQDQLLFSGGERVAYLFDGGRARRPVLELGPPEGDRILVRSGLSLGERLIISSQSSLREGQEVVSAP